MTAARTFRIDAPANTGSSFAQQEDLAKVRHDLATERARADRLEREVARVPARVSDAIRDRETEQARAEAQRDWDAAKAHVKEFGDGMSAVGDASDAMARRNASRTKPGASPSPTSDPARKDGEESFIDAHEAMMRRNAERAKR